MCPHAKGTALAAPHMFHAQRKASQQKLDNIVTSNYYAGTLKNKKTQKKTKTTRAFIALSSALSEIRITFETAENQFECCPLVAIGLFTSYAAV